MNSSNGFGGNNSLLGSSAGIKRRPLRPPSGILNKKPEFLRSIDISLSQPVIATSLRSQIAVIQQQINLLDKDKKLRQGEGGLSKIYVSALRKWLRESQALNEKEDDEVKILKQLGVENYEKGFQKLWKIVCNFDLVISKITELQIVNFLIYDEMFDEIGNDSQRSAALLSQIGNNGYNSGSFQITQIILDRLKDVYAGCKKGSNPIKTARDEAKSTEDKRAREETNQLISQLKYENQKLNSMLQQLVKQKEQQKIRNYQSQKPVEVNTKKQAIISTNTFSKSAFKEVQDKYVQQISSLNIEKNKFDFTIAELKAKISILQSQLKAANEVNSSKQFPPAKSGSFEQALKEEMDKMKKGFERRIASLTEDFTVKERDLRKKEIQYKNQNQKIKWEKSLLLKKFDALNK